MRRSVLDLLDLRPVPHATRHALGAVVQGLGSGLFLAMLGLLPLHVRPGFGLTLGLAVLAPILQGVGTAVAVPAEGRLRRRMIGPPR